MKKIILAAVMMFLLVSASAFAEATQKEEMPGMTTESPMGMPMPGMGRMGGPKTGNPQMVATDEGGVIVLAGNKLMKFDAELNLVKAAEVKMPVGSMGDKQCPMMGKMMEKGAAPAAADSQEKTA